MHPRSVFNKEPDFNRLAEKYESFEKFVKVGNNKRAYIDFKDPEAFDIDIDFPLDSLCPAVPNRLNYILWLQDLIDDTLTDAKDIIGIDIGVGASCIYPLLGCATDLNWRFLGTDIDLRSIDYAKENVKRNHLEDRITIQHTADPSKIFLLEDTVPVYTFSMCNPPFYSSQEELDEGLDNKELEPSAVCNGSNGEMITEGGEYGFISRMIEESLILQKRVIWYTSMMGLKRTIRPLVRLLKESGISNYVVTNFTQGNTTRWAIAWSFYDNRPTHIKMLESWLPKYSFEVELPQNTDVVHSFLKPILDDLDIGHVVSGDEDGEIILDCTVDKNTWSRAARRQRKRQKLESQEEEKSENPFQFKLELSSSRSPSLSYLQIIWLKGGDRPMFEGFWSHLKKRIEENCGIYRGSTFSK
ncbi:uncharacterized protein EV154DRAFT_432044 [Mucor mucedo]|uniref:uncharacterized protein n=1 Tax=Mucor mucedo TaxID=29922 RepID=UPI00221F3EE7|nr:uncharacterized protein EV154DRAFT_432044 [Mucor mucedo]KAI7869094.1 hypothetical protein EV154DRAFT_432044 [Mucor mucedo]